MAKRALFRPILFLAAIMLLIRGLLAGWLLPVAAVAQTVASSAPAPKSQNPPSPVVPKSMTGVVSLQAARVAGPGTTLTVRGVILNGRELGPVRFIQERSGAGLALVGASVPGFSQLAAGDSVEVRGILKNNNSLLEMNPLFVLRKLGTSQPRARRVPVAQAAAALTEANEGQLLRITGVSRLSVAGTGAETGVSLSAETTYLLDGHPGAAVRIPATSTGPEGLMDLTAPTSGPFDIIGVVSQAGGPSTPGGGYFLLPRQRGDFRREGGLPRLLEEPVPTIITPTTITLTYETLNAGDTRVSYGLNTAILREGPHDKTLTTKHTVTLENLRPGISYYIEASSTNEAGTAKSPPVLMITRREK
jgi:hypothetical protein